MGKRKTANQEKTFIVHWVEYHRGTIKAKNLEEAQGLVDTNGTDFVVEDPTDIVADNFYVEE